MLLRLTSFAKTTDCKHQARVAFLLRTFASIPNGFKRFDQIRPLHAYSIVHCCVFLGSHSIRTTFCGQSRKQYRIHIIRGDHDVDTKRHNDTDGQCYGLFACFTIIISPECHNHGELPLPAVFKGIVGRNKDSYAGRGADTKRMVRFHLARLR